MAPGRELAFAPDRDSGCHHLHAAAPGTGALAVRTVQVEHDVPELGGESVGAAVEAAVEQQPAADPGTEREHQRVPGAHGSAAAVLGEQGHIYVIVDVHLEAPQALAHQIAERHPRER